MKKDIPKLLLAVVILAIAGAAKGEEVGNVVTGGVVVGKLCGIGAVLRPDGKPGGSETIIVDHLDITEIITGSPSDKSGLKKGDEIIRVDGHSVVGMNFMVVATKLIRGKEGTPVKITVRRNGQAEPVSFTIIREPISLTPKH